MRRLSKVFSVVTLLSFVFISCAGNVLKRTASNLQKGIKTQNQIMIENSINKFEDLCKKNDKDHMSHYWAAKAHFAMADYLDLKSAEGKDGSGDGEKNIDEALEHLKQAIGIKEDYLDAYILKYLCLSKKFSYVGFPRLMMYVGEINETVEKAMKYGPEDPWANLVKGMSIATGFPKPDPKEPIAQFEKVLKLNPKMDAAYYNIALVYIEHKNIDEAKKNLQEALKINPDNHWAKKKLSGLEKKP
ncbi:MAG: hypothetical protein A2W05_04640 [Candidatus Schekmanbacteria bacterium RBG_16_38_10]|uniref:Uncharacterized protein n=1 Tax=Candidatus Schekmanbacteria bacterium RBG_16_38_10 TaxID=1817879 RepID=A0A1F7S2U5_9BACT|nr:MAG: hypothetical protein A2W05_04640 [Candidatus Schekmanbacteria bacterium RBG_16_38_10]